MIITDIELKQIFNSYKDYDKEQLSRAVSWYDWYSNNIEREDTLKYKEMQYVLNLLQAELKQRDLVDAI